jgi:hypothetical protein
VEGDMARDFWYVQCWADPDYAPKTYRFDGDMSLEEVKKQTQKNLGQLFMKAKRQVNIFKVEEMFCCEMMQGE